MCPPGSCSIFNFLIWSGLYWGLLSENIRGDAYSAGHLAHAYYFLSARSESFASRIQLRNALKTKFLNFVYCGCTEFVHASIVLIVKPRTYSCSLLFFILFHLILFSVYLSVLLLFGSSMTSDILSYLLIPCESSKWKYLFR